MLVINKYKLNDITYFEALFLGGNLIAFTVNELINDLVYRYGFKLTDITTELFHFRNLN